MSKRTVPALLMSLVIAVAAASPASAAMTWRRLGGSPFSRPPLASEADLRAMVKARAADLEAGFAKAGQADLYPAFAEQFPTARITTVTVAPGEKFQWMLFRKRGNGRLVVEKDVTWGGKTSFEAFRFDVDKGGQRYDFVVPLACGNVTVRTVAAIPPPPPPPPPPPKAAAPPPPPPAPVAAPAPPPPAPAPRAVAAPPPPPPVAAPAPKPAAPAPKVAAAPPPPPPPMVAAPVPAPVPAPAPPPAAKGLGGPVIDVGLSRQPDPANYLFGRIGYEIPLADRLYLLGLVGGYLRWMGNDGGSAFTADVLLDYHWAGPMSFGLGAGYWSGNDGQADLIANLGVLVAGDPAARNVALFLEARMPFDELDNPNDFGRFGLGLRFRL